MSMLTNQDLLRRVSLFTILSEDQLRSLSASVVKRRIKRAIRLRQISHRFAFDTGQAIEIFLLGRGDSSFAVKSLHD